MAFLMECVNFLYRFIKFMLKSNIVKSYMCITFVLGLFLVFDRLMKGHYR